MSKSIIYALCANLSFSLASLFFAHFAQKISSTWINFLKALVAGVCFFLAVLFTQEFHQIHSNSLVYLLISGFIGLGIGDIFLIKAFASIGPGRTMMLFSFHPIFVGVISFFAFNQTLPINKLFGIVFFILCLVILSFESFKKEKSWNVMGLSYALLGMLLDASGVILTKQAFEWQDEITAFEGNFYRCLGAILFFVIFTRFTKTHLIKNFRLLESKLKLVAILCSILGTFLSLGFYLKAIQITNQLAIISAISLTSVVFSTIFETIWKKSLPSKYFWLASIFFLVGMYFVLF